VAALMANIPLQSQDLPSEIFFSSDGHMLHTGGAPNTGLYQKEMIRTIDLSFGQANYWTLLTQNYQQNLDLPATMVVDGVTYDSVGVQFKGQTSYSQLPSGSQKKSFNISMDYVIEDQDLMGYQTLNLNNAFQDASFLREVIFLELIRDHIPAAKANFVHLNINGESWGLYPNVQQLNNDYVKEWFFNNNGTLWRADAPVTGGGGGGPQWGDGTAALNDLGNDTTTYKQYYTLKRTEQVQPWDDLVITCNKLNDLPASQLVDSLPKYMDVDRVLWFLASEIAFSDDDSYVHKGKMDYYLYWDEATGLMTPLEFDGNSVMKNNAVTWSAFYNADDANYPLLNRLLSVPELRQRYLAHLRTIINEKMQSSTFNALLASWSSLINAEVQADPKKLYTYTAFQNELTVLQNYITNRRNNLMANAEVAQLAPVISQSTHSVNGNDWGQPLAADAVDVRCQVNSTNGIFGVDLYYSHGLYGNFSSMPMYDDGLHNDGAAGDGTYGATLPAAPAMTYVRWYVEAVANNTAKSVSYDPPGVEHDVYIYQVSYEMMADAPVRINELMADNGSTISDQAGEFDDWIELFNWTDQPYDLSGHFLTDNGTDLLKYEFPDGTVMQPGSYLIIWADNEVSQGSDHAAFGLSASGESVWLSNGNGIILDHVDYGDQIEDMGFARVPNGTGPFVIQSPTFAANNEFTVSIAETGSGADDLVIFPNPAQNSFSVIGPGPSQLEIMDATGRLVLSERINGRLDIEAGLWTNGTYLVRCGNVVKKLVIAR
jgi:hypothetical protein